MYAQTTAGHWHGGVGSGQGDGGTLAETGAQKKAVSAIDGRTTRHGGYAVSLRKRKRVEEIFDWAKTVGGLHKAKFIGLAKVKAQTVFTFKNSEGSGLQPLLGSEI